MIGYFLAALTMQPATSTAPSEVPKESAALPLFASDNVMDITIRGPIRRILRTAQRSTEQRPASLIIGGQAIPVRLAPRGLTRRTTNICDFPPLRIRFDGDVPTTEFSGQKDLKLVTHCKDSGRYEQGTLREYAAYRMYNVMTPESLGVRLARIRYEETDGNHVVTRMGFFIEDIDAAAKRLGGKEINLPSLRPGWFNDERSARYLLFQYLIGNLDWSMYRGPAGSNCCHNSKTIGATREARADLTPIPYDFDQSGWVDTPYMLAPEKLPVRTPKQRLYRGACYLNGHLIAEATALRAKRGEMERIVANIPGLSDGPRNELREYLADFFRDIRDDASVKDKLLDDCRG